MAFMIVTVNAGAKKPPSGAASLIAAIYTCLRRRAIAPVKPIPTSSIA